MPVWILARPKIRALSVFYKWNPKKHNATPRLHTRGQNTHSDLRTRAVLHTQQLLDVKFLFTFKNVLVLTQTRWALRAVIAGLLPQKNASKDVFVFLRLSRYSNNK